MYDSSYVAQVFLVFLVNFHVFGELLAEKFLDFLPLIIPLEPPVHMRHNNIIIT